MARIMLKRHSWIALLLLAACAQAPERPERVVEPRPGGANAPRGSVLLQRVMLAGHNRARGDVGVAPITWSEPLAASARGYAETMARTGRFEHAVQSIGMDRQGENLWTGTRGAYRYDEMIRHWVAEKRDFVNVPAPQFSRTGRWQDVGHYTQIVWRATTQVGCALASNATDDYLVCRYAPPGNVVGQRTF
ncbi:CAP domain-containing protein [Sphingomonadaceae bacterium OTU29LAMAA1]|nr:CAP domain-containing protein [Sphingomonadaceae bacterium OTU29LAMAA1]